MYNLGGPGPALVYDAATILTELRTLFPAFDVVIMDNRGTGFSSPLSCVSLDDEGAFFAALDERLNELPLELDSEGELTEESELALGFAAPGIFVGLLQEACQETLPSTLPYYNTENVARDMDAIRAALGEEQLNYWGISYGTLQGALYAKLFPERVRAFALDSVVLRTEEGPNYVEEVTAMVNAYEEQLNRFLDETGQDPQSALYQHPLGTPEELFDALSAELEAGVQWEGEELGPRLLLNISIPFLRRGDWSLLAQVINDAAMGDWWLAAEYGGSQELTDEEYERDWLEHQAGTLIRLLDIPCPLNYTPEQAENDVLQFRSRFPRMFRMGLAAPAHCLAWSVPRSEPVLTPRDLESPPLLLLNGLYDPATPYVDALALLDVLNNGSRLLTGDMEGHAVGPSGTCSKSALTEFVRSADVNSAPELCMPGEQVAAARKLRQLASHKPARRVSSRLPL
jgi:pimeloyl-ACP methyl ester carboxylesterase